MSTLNIDPAAVTAVLIQGAGWVSAHRARLVSISSPGRWPAALGFEGPEGGYIYLPLSSILAVRTRSRVMTAEEIEAEREAREAEAEATWLYLTYAPSRQAFEEAVKAQDGICAAGPAGICGGANVYEATPIQHYRDGKVFCSMDSNMKLRAA